MKFLSFPPRVAILIGLIILIPAVLFSTGYIAKGYMQITSPVPGAYLIDEQENKIELPTTLLRNAGRHSYQFGAPGYLFQTNTVTFPAFRIKKTIAITLDKKKFSEEDPEAYKKIPLGSVLPYFETGIFEINFPDESGMYTIRLLAHPNWYPSETEYREALKQDKQKATSWIQQQKIDPASLKINWDPYDPDVAE